jgi:phage shock protein A
MASIIRAVGNWFRSKRDSAAEALGDPARDSKFAIEDSKAKVAEFTAKLAKLAAETHRLERERDNAATEIAKWQRIAEKAAAENEVDDARTALKNKADAAKRETTLADEITRNEEVTAKMRDQLNAARAKIAQAESNRVRLVARLEGAKVRQELAKARTEFNSDASPLAALDDLQRTVDTVESEADAWEDIAGDDAKEKDLEKKYEDAPANAAIEAELEALMQGKTKED